jgi:hypothetical protein
MKRYLAGGAVAVSAVAGMWVYRADPKPPQQPPVAASAATAPLPNPGSAPAQPASPPEQAARPSAPLASSPMAELKPSPHAVPAVVMQQLPKNHHVLAFQSSDFNGDGRRDFVVVVGRDDEKRSPGATEPAPQRPLMVFLQGEREDFALSARNDKIVYTADQGGQCDPFLDGSEKLAAKGEFFTVQNGVACGQHWTDYITFKYSTELGQFVFHKRIFESQELNRAQSSSGPALVPTQRTVTAAQKSQPIGLADYAPAR